MRKVFLAGLLSAIVLTLFGCGGGGGSSSSIPTVSGTASQGSAFPSGSPVTLTDAKGVIAQSIVTGNSGAYTVPVNGLTAPFFLNASSASGKLYSYASGAGITNINPFTHLSVQTALGTSTINSSTLSSVPSTFQTIFNSVVSQLKTALSALYPSAVPSTQTDFLNGNISIGSGVDLVFASTTISPPGSSGNFSITVSGQPIITGNTSSGNVTITPNNSAISTAGNTLYPDITVSGQVTLNGVGLGEVSVTLTGTGSSTVKTNSSGAFTFTYVQNGSYTLSASLAGYTMSASQPVTVNGANVSGITFTATVAPTTPFTTAMVSGKTFGVALTINNEIVSSGLATYNSNGSIDYSDTTNDYNTGTWAINSAGQLILTWTTGTLAGEVDTKTIAGITSTTITVNESIAIPGSQTLTGTMKMIPLSSIAVTPANTSLPAGATQQFTATGTFADNSTQNITSLVTWSSSNKSYATIASGGLATGVAAGPTTITASSGAITGTTSLTVTASTSNAALNALQAGIYQIGSINYTPPNSTTSINVYDYHSISLSGSANYYYYAPSTNTWSTNVPTGYVASPIYTLTASGWVLGYDQYTNNYVANADGSITITNSLDGSRSTISISDTNISNQTISSAYPRSSNWPLLNNGSANFPSGSLLYTNTITYLTDSYILWGDEVQNHVPLTVLSNAPSVFSNVNIDAKGSFYCTFDSTGSTATIWQYQNSTGTSSNIGSATWAITTVDGQQLLEISIPNTLRTQYQLGGNPIIAIVSGNAWVGEHAIPNFIEYGYSGGNSLNTTAFNFLLTQFNSSQAQ